ncbi:6122_t:CDS:2 [Rhizophagus irregularis]|nr:6122_t:CDS:2 [Rhizophagus irregularis]
MTSDVCIVPNYQLYEDGSPAIDDCERNWSEKDIKALGEALKGCIPHIRWFHIEPSELFNKIWPLKEIFPQDLLEEIFRHHFTPNLPIDSSTFGLSPYTWYNLNGVKISRPRRPEYAVRIKDRTCGPCFGDKDLWMTSNFNEDENCSAVKDDYDFEITSTEKFAVDEYEVFQVLKKVVIKDASNSVTTNNNENENLLGGGDDATVDATNDVDVGTVNDVNDVNDDGIDTTNAAITTNTTNS